VVSEEVDAMSADDPEDAAPRRWEGVIRVQKHGPARPVRSAAQLDPPADPVAEEAEPAPAPQRAPAWPVAPSEWSAALLHSAVVHSMDCPLQPAEPPVEETADEPEAVEVAEVAVVENEATEPEVEEPEVLQPTVEELAAVEPEPVEVPAVPVGPIARREPRVPASRREADPLVSNQTIGETLSAARRSAGLTHEQLARITRIGVARLVEFENDDYSGCGAGVFARGRLDSIARAVGVDPTPLLADFDARHGHGHPLAAPAAGHRQPIRTPRNWSMVLLWALALAAVYPVVLLVLAVFG
jgi:transcriptional regulator with XRE-family HTH domain